jgi:hypothetical protein
MARLAVKRSVTNKNSKRLTGQRLHEDLHTTAKAEDQVERRFLLNIVVGQGTTVLELLASEDEALLVRGNAFLILNLGFNVVDGVGRLDLERDGLAWNRFRV